MSIKIIEDPNKLVRVKFGKGNVAVMLMTNIANGRNAVLFAPTKKTKIGEKPTENKEGSQVLFEFTKPQSVDVIIRILQGAKEKMIADYTKKQTEKAEAKIKKFAAGE